MTFEPTTNLFANLDALNLTKRQRGFVVPHVVRILEESRTRVGRVLLKGELGKNGRPLRWSQKDMRAIELEIQKKVTYRPLTCEVLRVLRKACSVWVMRHEMASIPRLGVILKPFENPVNRNLPLCLAQYRAWAAWLHSYLERSSANNVVRKIPAPINTIEPLLISSILYGGLFERASVVTLLNELPNLLSNVLDSETTMYVGLRVPWGGTGQTEFRCWQPDPVTAILLARTSPQAHFNLQSKEKEQGSISFKTLTKSIHEIRRSELARDQNSDLCGLETLIKAVQTIAYVQFPAIIAAYGSRKFHSDSLPFEAIMRIAKANWIIRPGPDATPASASRANGRSEVRNYTTERPWSTEFNAAIRDDMKWSLVTENLHALAEGEKLPPLGRRLADFAARVFSVRTLYDKRRSAKTMTTRLLLLADGLSRVHGTADIIGLPSESLEHLYRKAIQDLRNRGTSCRETNSFLRVLRELHSYLCALHGKVPLSDDKLLAPLPVLDRADANILTTEEYKRLLSIIELRWPPDEDFERRRIARLMVVLGFRAGLRTEECRLLRVNDLILRGRKQLWVRPSKGHTLKSDHSLRRIEIWKLLSKEELEDLERWITGRNLSGSDFLFKTSALDVVPPSIFETINGFMREVTGGSNVGGHFHHCRHSLASHGTIKLLIGEGSDIQKLLTSEASTAYPRTASHMYMNPFRKRKDIFLLARLLGHCHPATTVRYSHVFGLLLRYFIRRSTLMQPEPILLSLALGNSQRHFDHHPNEAEAIASAVKILGSRNDFRHLASAEGLTSAHAESVL